MPGVAGDAPAVIGCGCGGIGSSLDIADGGGDAGSLVTGVVGGVVLAFIDVDASCADGSVTDEALGIWVDISVGILPSSSGVLSPALC